MNRKYSWIIGLWVIFLFLCLMPSTATAMGPLQINPTNPRYFLNSATGETVYLTGSHTWSNFLNMGDTNPPELFPFDSYLNMMESHGHNFIRLWAWELTSTKSNPYCQPHPWQRTGSSKALDGLPKFDLKKFNQDYFDRLRERVIDARKLGIYVSIMLFEGWGVQFAPNRWTHHPLNRNNNRNRINGDPNGDGYGYEIHRLQIPAITDIQKAYIRKVVDTVNDLDNVMYEICNEDGGGTMAWQEAMKSYLKSYQATKDNQHVVGITGRWDGDTSREAIEAECFASSGDWVSPARTIYRSNPPANNTRVIISDTDHLWGIGGSRDWVWKSFCRGLNPIFMDPYDDWTMSMTEETAISIRKAMGETKSFADLVDMSSMAPQSNLASTGFCLAHVLDPGPDEYIAYIPSGTSITMNLTNSSGNLTVDWFNTVTGVTKSGGTVLGGSSGEVFTAPFSYAVLLLKEVATAPTAPTVTDWQYPGTAANVARSGSGTYLPNWVNPDNAKSNPSTYTNTNPGNPDNDQYSNWLRLTNFEFNIPAGATITGIEMQKSRLGGSSRTQYSDSAIYLRKTSGQVEDNRSLTGLWDTVIRLDTHGGSTDLWGASWSAEDINSANFGVDISIKQGVGTTTDGYIYYVRIRVHYTL